MAATSLKLPDDLKERLAQLAAAAGQTPHAYMVAALARDADMAERRAQFTKDAAAALHEVMTSGKSHSLDAVTKYFAAKAAGKKPKRPRARSWRTLK